MNPTATASQPGSGSGENVLFTPHSTWETKNNILSGIHLSAWLTILSQRWQHIEWKRYWFRCLFITFLATLNSVFALLDYWFYSQQYTAAVLNDSPIFVLGHPRTGTTLLHNLLARDTAQFAAPNTFQVGFPNGFLTLEKHNWMLESVIGASVSKLRACVCWW
jgi:hypothetical protein